MAADGRVEEEGPDAPPPPPVENFFHRWNRRTEALLNSLVSESALKIHLLIYWLFVLGQLLGPKEEDSHHSPWLLLLVLIAGVAVVCAMMGVASQSPGFLYPIIFVALLETARFAVYSFNMVILASNIELIPQSWMLFQPFGDRRDFVLVCLYACLSTYFFMMALTAGALFLTYRTLMIQQAQLQLRVAAMRNNMVRQLQQTGVYLVANGNEPPVDRNVDSPPNYSAVILEAPEAVVTAKEETSPPRYSQIDPLMYQGTKSTSSDSSKV